MMIDKVIFGNRVKMCRMSSGLSQEAFAEMCDCSQIFISKIERGVSLPSLSMFTDICTNLNVSMDFLLAPALTDTHSITSSRNQKILEIYRLAEELLTDNK